MPGATAVVGVGAWRHRAKDHDPWRGTLVALVGLSVLASIVMFVLSTIERSYCPFCIAWYGINLALGICTWLARGPRQETSVGQMFDDSLGRTGLVAALGFIVTFAAGQWVYSARKADLQAELDTVLDTMVAQIRSEPATTIDLRALPKRGPDDAALTIVEVADFQCPYCRRLWQATHDYTEHNTTSVQVAFVHYPLDDHCNGGVQQTHPLACQASEAIECARAQDEDKFWAYGDLLFENQPAFEPDDLVGYAGQLGLDQAAFTQCLEQHESLPEVRRSIRQARQMKVRLVPTYFVNGRVFEGAPKPWMPLLLDKWARAIAAEGAAPEQAPAH